MMAVSNNPQPHAPTAASHHQHDSSSITLSQRRTTDNENASNALNSLTEKIARRLRDELESDPDVLKHRERNVAAQYQCGICFELLLGDRHPKIIVPCGHTFCAVCINHHIKVSTTNCVCPYCRAKIQSTAVNHHLRQLVEAYAANQNVGVAMAKVAGSGHSGGSSGSGSGSGSGSSDSGAGGGGMAGARYLREYNMLKTRRRILMQEQSETKEEMRRLLKTWQNQVDEERRIMAEEKQAAADVNAAKKRLERVRSRLAEQQVSIASAKEQKVLAETKLEMIASTLETIARDADKAHILASAAKQQQESGAGRV